MTLTAVQGCSFLSIKEGKGGAGQQVSGGCQGARRKKSDRRSSPAGAAFFVRGEAYPLMSPRNLLGGSLFLTLRTWLPPTHFSFCVKGFATPVRKKSSSVQPLPRPHLAVFFPPRPLTQKETCPTPPRSFPSPVLEMNSLGGHTGVTWGPCTIRTLVIGWPLPLSEPALCLSLSCKCPYRGM